MKELYGNIHYYYCRFGVGWFMMISLDSMIESRLTASNKRVGWVKKIIESLNTLKVKDNNNRAAELVVANKELHFQNEEKEKRAAELVVAAGEIKKLAFYDPVSYTHLTLPTN